MTCPEDPFLSTFLCDVLAHSVLPAPWSLCRDDHNNLFFWNQTSNETAWVLLTALRLAWHASDDCELLMDFRPEPKVHPLDATLREVMAAFQTCIQLPTKLRDQTLNSLQDCSSGCVCKQAPRVSLICSGSKATCSNAYLTLSSPCSIRSDCVFNVSEERERQHERRCQFTCFKTGDVSVDGGH